MATGVKAAAFAALFRIIGEGLYHAGLWREVIYGLALATMIGGNVIALAQRSVKRMLAYSSVAHAGYLLVAVAAASPPGASAFLFYLVAYTLMTIGAFALVAAMGRSGESDVQIDDFAGLAQRRPWLAALLTLCLLSLLGFPPTAGFIGKWSILLAATEAGQAWLATALVVTSVVSAGYYLPVVMAMYMRPEAAADAHSGVVVGRVARTALVIAAAGIVAFGVRPTRLLELSRQGGTVIHAAPAAGSVTATPPAPTPGPDAREDRTPP
jgi:NADH-quinone oxidoreductase subunit N